MQIPIKLAKPGEIPEWCLVELQGTLDMSNVETLGEHSIGDLVFTKQGEPILIIGHHELRGKEVKLDKPILILRKKKSADINESQDLHMSSAAAQMHFEIQGVAKRKILFKNRPKPIVTVSGSKTVRFAPKPTSENSNI